MAQTCPLAAGKDIIMAASQHPVGLECRPERLEAGQQAGRQLQHSQIATCP